MDLRSGAAMSKKARNALLNPKSVGNLRAVEKEIRRLRRMPGKDEVATSEEAIAKLERFRGWYLRSIKERGRDE